MQYLWTPWRMQYISGAHENVREGVPVPPAEDANVSEEDRRTAESESGRVGCVFCDRVRLPESHDRASLILLRAVHNFVIMNLYPYNSAHLMIVPYKHTADLRSLDAGAAAEMMRLAQHLIGVIGDEYHPQGYNVGMNLGEVAGAGVADHIHMHIVPRWVGDTNFMPVVGATKVLPELLETTYDRLKARLR
jgi:ATP adenylyltransferase